MNTYSPKGGRDAFSSKYVLVPDRNGKIREINAFTYWWNNTKQKFVDYDFNPEVPNHIQRGDDFIYNIWTGFDVEPNPDGNCSLFLKHLEENVCDGEEDLMDYVLDWFAQTIQFPEKKIGIVMALRGKQGTGKSIVAQIFGKLLGGRHFKTFKKIDEITARFNKALAQVIFILADEVLWGGDKKVQAGFKNIITDNYMTIEPKYMESKTFRNFLRILMTSNEDWMAPVEISDRRFFVLDVNDNAKNDRDFFGQMIHQLEHENGYEKLLHVLQTRDISERDWSKIPMTKARMEQIVNGLDRITRWIYDSLTAGSMMEYTFLTEGDFYKGHVDIDEIMFRYNQYEQKKYPGKTTIESNIGKKIQSIFKFNTNRWPSGNRKRYYLLPSKAEVMSKLNKATSLEITEFDLNQAISIFA